MTKAIDGTVGSHDVDVTLLVDMPDEGQLVAVGGPCGCSAGVGGRCHLPQAVAVRADEENLGDAGLRGDEGELLDFGRCRKGRRGQGEGE